MNISLTSQRGQCPFHQPNNALDEKAASFDMFGEAYQTNPAESLRQFREEKPIFFSEKMNYWIVTRYQDIKEIFRDPVTFSARNVLEKFSPNSEEANQILKSYNYGMNRTLVNEDEPIHMERRRELLDAFSAPNLEELREVTKRLVREQVDAFIKEGKTNLLSNLLWEVPIVIALKFLGVPDDDIAKLQKFGVAHKVNTWGRPSEKEQIHVATMVGKFWHFSGEVLERMKANSEGKSGWMYDMIHKNKSNPTVVTDNYLHSMMMAILVAAHETTSTATANAIIHLLSRPNLWQKLHDEPHLIPGAVEECLRHSGPIVSWRRQATKDVEISGVKIKEGDKLFLVMASANHDPEHFENPDEIDILRDNASEHLSFGYGAHQCMGRNIGRMEMCVIIEELTRRIPHLQLSDQKFTNLPNTSFHGPEELWVEWDSSFLVPEGKVQNTFSIGNPDKKIIYRDVKVVADNEIATGLKEIILETNDDILELPAWTPGAHIELLLPNGLDRKYSLCPSDKSNQYVIVVKKEEEGEGGSLWIHENLKVGDTLKIKGPKNFFKLNEKAENYLLVAGGIGITPILAMAATLKRQNKEFKLVYCGRNRDGLAYLDRLNVYADDFDVYVSSEGNKADFDAIMKAQKKGTLIYACGPEKLLNTLEKLAEQYNFELKFELFGSGSSLLNPELENTFDVELIDTGKVYHVPKHKTLLEVLLDNEIDLPHDCLEGLCGSCEVIVIEGEIDHRDKSLSTKERESNQKMITCCSRAQEKIKIKL